MSDKTEVVAAAQVLVSASSISFKANSEFKTATKSAVGLYDLELEHEHDRNKLVIHVTRNNTVDGTIEASMPIDKHIQINVFGADGVVADSSFWITVRRIGG
jgi:hypothetical protein